MWQQACILIGGCALLCAALPGRGDAGDSKEEAAAKELKQLAGTWIPTSAQVNGSIASPEEVRKMKVVLAGEKWTLHLEGKTAEATFKIDPTKKPKTIDFHPANAKGQVLVGIYELNGDTLRICLPEPSTGKERPTEFSGKDGKSLTIYEREKSK
jgi:uncharacterized protein (TIGR03067 family)